MLKKFSSRVTIAALAVSLALFVASPVQVRADDRSHCQHAVEKAEANLDRAIAKNGERSHEAESGEDSEGGDNEAAEVEEDGVHEEGSGPKVQGSEY